MKWKFTIPGVPVPYLRMTQAEVRLMRIPDHKMRPAGLKVKQRIQRYFDYKSFVYASCQPWPISRTTLFPSEKIFLNIVIFFKNHSHGDPDNIFKAIADSLFIVDKYVAGSMDFYYDPLNPRVEVEVDDGQSA